MCAEYCRAAPRARQRGAARYRPLVWLRNGEEMAAFRLSLVGR